MMPEIHQAAIDEAALAKDGHPGIDAQQIAGPERQNDQHQHRLAGLRAADW